MIRLHLIAAALAVLVVPPRATAAGDGASPATPDGPAAAVAADRDADRQGGAPGPGPTWWPEVHGRYVTVPDFVADALFAAHPSMHGYSVGAGLRWRWRDSAEWRFSVDWLQMGYAPGNWLETELPPASAVFLDWDLGFLSAAASYVWLFDLVADRLQLAVGVGAAVGVFVGDVYATDVVPTCTEPVSACVPWRRATRRALELPTRVLGLPIITVGLDARLVGALSLRLEGGLYGIPYAGGALSYGAW